MSAGSRWQSCLRREYSRHAILQVLRLGNPDVETKASFGIAMMGGGSDLDEAFRWLY